MKLKLTDEEKDTMSYDDVAYLILKEIKTKIKIQDLYKKVLTAMDLPESTFESTIGDFFELILTDKRFIMLDGGYCDLKINHSTKIIIDEDNEDYEVIPDDEDSDEQGNEIDEDNYDDTIVDDIDDDDDLQDLVIVDENEETDIL